MRKIAFLIVLSTLTLSNVGCGGKIRSWFHRGSPCGTKLSAPPVLGAPLALSAPVAAPVMAAPPQVIRPSAPAVVGGACGCCPTAPICTTPCIPCEPACGNPYGDGWTAGYGGVSSSPGCSTCGSGQVYDGAVVGPFYNDDYSGSSEPVESGAPSYPADPTPEGDN